MIILEILLVAIALLFAFPLILTVVNSLKTNSEIMLNVFSFLPSGPQFQNYVEVWERMRFPLVFFNTLFITVGTTAGDIVFGSMAGYKLSRTRTRYSSVMFYVCISPMIITFSSIMITLTWMAKKLGLMGSLWGIIIVYWGLVLPFAIFLFHGFVKTIPFELEEAALIDGCGKFRNFVQIVFPLLLPATTTVAILNSITIWNDFLTPLLMIGSRAATRTLTLAANVFVGMYYTEYQLTMAAFCLSSLPIVVFFLFMQKYIVKGITTGAVKG